MSEETTTPEEDLHSLFLLANRAIYKFFANRGFDRETCLELTQETFLEASRSWGGFRGQSSPEAWLFGIAKKIWVETLRNSLRKKRKADLVPLNGLATADQRQAIEAKVSEAVGNEEPLETLLGNERARLVREAIHELPERMRFCALLYFLQEREIPEIAEILQIKKSTVRSQLAQARKRLRESLSELFPDML